MRSLAFLAAGGAVLWLLKSVASGQAPQATQVKHASWADGAVIYELNTRQFTPEGTFRAILPRVQELKALGVSVVWFMPIHPIGEKHRKGTLGSPYAVRDFMAVNPEFGTLEDFKTVVRRMHDAGLHVIIDLVINHTSWDNPLVLEHPEWYRRGLRGGFVPPVPDWADVIGLDYRQRGLREYMLKMMEYWVRDIGIDGYRADVAGMVPTDFWNEARPRLEAIKPVFMLAEAEKPELLRSAFDADYASELFNTFDRIARGKATARDVARLLESDAKSYPPGSWRMNFTTNHDQNSWLDSDINRLGERGARAFAVLAFTLLGRPLIYNGQEIGNRRKLAFFERDPIDWSGGADTRAFYARLAKMHREHASLHRGVMEIVPTNRDNQVLAFYRWAEGDTPFLIMANLSNRATEVKLKTAAAKELNGLRMDPWETKIVTVPGWKRRN